MTGFQSGSIIPVEPGQSGGRRLRPRLRPVLLASSSALVILALAGRAHGASINWTGATSSDWNTPTNWSTGAAPTSADSVTVDTTSPNSTTIDATTTPAAGSLAVGDGATGFLLIQNGGRLTTSGDTMFGVNVGASGSAAVTGTSSWDSTAHDIYVGYAGHGVFTINGAGAVVSDRNGSIGELGSGVGQVTVNAGHWNNSGDLAVGNIGTGTLLITGGGVVQSGAATTIGGSAGATGTVTIDGSNSQLNASATVYVGMDGAGTVNVRNGGALTSRGGNIAANSKNSSGAVVVDGTNSSWSTGTGSLAVGYSGTGSLLVSNGAAVYASGASLGYFAGSSGTVTVDGSHSVFDTSNSSSVFLVGLDGQGAVTVRNGAAMFAQVTMVGGGAGSGVLNIDGAGTQANSGLLALGIAGTGTLNLTGGALLTSSGGAVLGNAAGSQGTASVAGASTRWDLNGGNLYVGVSGTGALTVSNGGSVTSSGGMLYIAQHAGSTGIVNIGADPSSAAAAPGTVDLAGLTFLAGAGTLNFNHTGLGYVFAPKLSGSGTIDQIAGDTILSGASSAFTGAANVTGGWLAVNGSLSHATLSVSGTGTLAGTGTIGDTQIKSGGTFAPGSGTPGSSINVAGNLAFQSGAAYLVQVNPATASLANVTGTASLGGTVQLAFANGSYVSKTYTILSASGGISGSFAPTTVNSNLPGNFSTSLSYDSNNAYLNLVLDFAIPGGLNRNQQAVGNALTNYFNANGSIPVVYAALSPAGLTQASGELATGSQQASFNAMSQFTGLLTDPFMQRGGGAGTTPGTLGYAEENGASERKPADAFAMFAKAPPRPFEPRWSVWAAGFGGAQSTDGNAAVGSNDTTSRIAGTAVGADYLFSPNTLAGFALAGGGTNFSVNGLGSGRSDLFQAGAYVRHTAGPAYITAALAYGWQDITTDRTVTVAGADHLRAQFNANAYSGRAEGGYRFVAPATGDLGVTPYAAAQFTTFDLPAYAEQVLSGSSAFALSYAPKSVTDARSELGVRTDKSYALGSGVLTLRGRLAWAHDFNPDRSIAATFQALPGASFVVNGAEQARDSLLTTVSIETRWQNGWSAAATFEGEFSEVTRSYAGKGVVRYAW